MKILQTSRQIGRTLKNAGRLRTIVGVFAKHGFANVAERIKLGKFILERLNAASDIESLTVAERARMSFEELGPTFVKLGQLLATRPDLVPDDFVTEFSKLHAQVQPIPYDQVIDVLREEGLLDRFLKIEEEVLGSASIAQVHRAKLADGSQVVVKVQRPGVIQTINDDLNVLYLLAELLETYVPESKVFSPVAIVDEYFKTLELETNFVVEANNIRRFSANFASEPDIKIPKVHFDLVTERVLTMEALDGTPLSSESALQQDGINPDEIIKKGLKAYLKMVFSDGLFHGDLHAGNFFVLPNNQIGLIDFGVVGRLNTKTRSAIASMLLALSKEDYDRLAYEYIDLAPFNNKVNADLFAKDLRDLIAPFYGLTLRNVNLGRVLLSSSSIAAKHHVSVPTELMLFFKSLVGIEGLGRRIQKDFDFLAYSLEFAGELVRLQYEPARIINDFSQIARESKSLLNSLPRQLHFLLRKINSPDHAIKFQIRELDDLKKSVELSFNLLFLGIIIGCLLLSSSLIFVQPTENHIAGMPTMSFIGYSVAGILSVIAFINYIKK
jgi:ubiquinone biosynthesis protein